MMQAPKVPNARVYASLRTGHSTSFVANNQYRHGVTGGTGLCQNFWCVSIIVSLANHLSLLHTLGGTVD
jgi:hypothetical protein